MGKSASWFVVIAVLLRHRPGAYGGRVDARDLTRYSVAMLPYGTTYFGSTVNE